MSIEAGIIFMNKLSIILAEILPATSKNENNRDTLAISIWEIPKILDRA
jgi:hypothetical protein